MKRNTDEEFNKIFDEVQKKKPAAEVVVGFGTSEKPTTDEKEENTEEISEQEQEEKSSKIKIEDLLEIIKNSVDFDDFKSQIAEMLKK